MVRLWIEPTLCVAVSHTSVNVHTGMMRVDLHTDIASLVCVRTTWTYGGESGPKDRSLQLCLHGIWLTNERNTQLGDIPQRKKKNPRAPVYLLFYFFSHERRQLFLHSGINPTLASHRTTPHVFFLFRLKVETDKSPKGRGCLRREVNIFQNFSHGCTVWCCEDTEDTFFMGIKSCINTHIHMFVHTSVEIEDCL